MTTGRYVFLMLCLVALSSFGWALYEQRKSKAQQVSGVLSIENGGYGFDCSASPNAKMQVRLPNGDTESVDVCYEAWAAGVQRKFGVTIMRCGPDPTAKER